MARFPFPASGVLALAGLLAGCSQAPPVETPQAAAAEPVPVLEPMAEAVGEEEAAEEAPAPDVTAVGSEAETERKEGDVAPRAVAERDATVVAVAGSRSRPRTLWEAAVEAREKRQESPPVRTSITDENLHEFQDAELTYASPRPQTAAEADAAEGESGEGAAEDSVKGEAYWRSRLRDLRLRLREAVDELAELDERAAGLRRSFYAADDPYVRDAEIKPAWDRALDRIGEVRREIHFLSEELEDALEAGRRAGALPGWLREGIELEPEPEELPQRRDRPHEPGEPEVMEIEPPPPAAT